MKKIATTKKSIHYLCCVFLISLLFQLPALLLQAQTVPAKLWDRTYGGSRDDGLYALVPTSDGGWLLAGSSLSEVSGDKTEATRGGSDFWVVKLNANGSKAWDRTYGGSGNDELRAAVSTADGGFLVGGMSNSPVSGDKTGESKGRDDFWVVKLNADGSKAWDRTYGGGADEELTSIIRTTDGGFLVGGVSLSDASGDKTEASRGFGDYWLVKLNADGSKAWDKTYGGSDWDGLYALTTTPDGGYLAGGYALSGNTNDKSEVNRGGFDYWVVKLNANGSKAWDKTVGGANPDYLRAVVSTSDGGYLLAGNSSSDVSGDKTEATRGGDDYWVVKLNGNGTKAWDRTFGGNSTEELQALISTSDGGFLLGGSSLSGASGEKAEASRGETDYWVVRLNAAGNMLWNKTYGGSDTDVLRAITRTNDGGYLLGGYSRSGASGEKTEGNRGGFDYWVVRLNADALSTALPEAKSGEFVLYPNPAHGQFYLTFPDLQQPAAPVEIKLYNNLGQQVLRQQVTGLKLQEGISLDVQAMTAGSYYLQLQLQDKVLTRKVVLE